MKKFFLIFSIIGLVLSIWALYMTMPWTRNLILVEGDQIEKIQLPLYQEGEGGKVYEIKGEIKREFIWQKKIGLSVDGCVLEVIINDKKIYDGSNDCRPGLVKLNLKDLDYGKNSIKIKFRNFGSDLFLYFGGLLEDKLFLTVNVFVAFFLSFLVFDLFWIFGLPKSISLIFAVGLFLRFFYFSYTDFNQRSHDNGLGGHLSYLQFVGDNLSLPSPNEGWEFYQPPFYYILAGSVYRISRVFNLYNAIRIQQIFNVFLFMGFAYFGFLIFREFLSKKIYLFLATALLVFWPSGIMHSTRIGNDVLYYFLFAASFYFLVKWFKIVREYKELKQILGSEKIYFLLLSVLFANLAIFTKLNGLILCVVFFITLAYLFLKNFKPFVLKEFLPFFGKCLVLLLLTVLPLSITIARKTNEINRIDTLIVDNSDGLGSDVRIQNNLLNYWYFDIHYLFQEPFAEPHDNKGGRNFLMVYLFKTALIGEWEFNGVQDLVVSLYFVFINLMVISLIGFCLMKKKIFSKIFLLIVFFIASILAMVFLRFGLPFSCSQDFRYIFPILIPLIIFIFLGIDCFRRKKIIFLEYFCYLSVIVFVVLSILLVEIFLLK